MTQLSEDPLPEVAWAQRMVKRWRRAWFGFYVLLSVVAWLLSSVPLSAYADRTGNTIWHWPMLVGGFLAVAGLRTRLPLVEFAGIIGCTLTLSAYVYVSAVLSFANETGPGRAGVGFLLLLVFPVGILAMRAWDVWTFPRHVPNGRRP